MQHIEKTKTYEETAQWITHLLRTQYLDEDGIFILGYSEGNYIKQQIIDDFGDVAPFISLYGGEDMCIVHLMW